MGMTFEIVGKLRGIKDKDNFHPYEVKTFDSGWTSVKYRFNVVSGNNRFMCEIGGGKWKDESKNKIYTFSAAAPGEKCKKLEIAWEDRHLPEIIDSVAGFRRYTIDLLTSAQHSQAETEGKEDEAAKKLHEYLEPTEYAEFVKKVIDSDKYKDVLFRIRGTMEFNYSESKNQFYRTMSINKIYRVDNDTDVKATTNIEAYYTKDSLDDSIVEDTGKYVFNCYTPSYFGSVKENRFVPVSLMLYNNDEKKANALKKRLTAFDDEEVRKYNLVADMIDGSEESAITVDDLSDEARENIELGFMTEEEALRAAGGNKMGNRITEYRICGVGRGSVNGSEPTAFTIEDLRKLPVVEITDDDDDVDLFADDEI